MSTILCLITAEINNFCSSLIMLICLTLFFCPETAATGEDDSTFPIYGPDQIYALTSADCTSAPTNSVGNTNFRNKLLFSHPKSSGLTTTTINSSGKQNCPNKVSKGRG